jgi:branched-chain amino acid aminotransferase
MQIWLNDQLKDSDAADVNVGGWPSGEGVFETIRTQDGEVFELGRHMRRALEAATSKGFSLPNEEVVRSGIHSLLIAEPQAIGRLRLLFSKDRFIAVHQRYEDVTKPVKLAVVEDSVIIESISIKTYPYEHRLDLLEQAQKVGLDEIICVNEDDEVSEGAVSNFLFRIDGKWITTPLSSGVLPGIQRAIVIERCGVAVKQIFKFELERVDAAFVISSLKIALSVASISGKSLQIDEDCKALATNIWANTHSHSVG